jgi:hypothetical protein
VCDDHEIAVPGSRSAEDGHISVGRTLGPAFRKAAEVEKGDGLKVRSITIGGFEITRLERQDEHGNARRCYVFHEKGTAEMLAELGKEGLFA